MELASHVRHDNVTPYRVWISGLNATEAHVRLLKVVLISVVSQIVDFFAASALHRRIHLNHIFQKSSGTLL